MMQSPALRSSTSEVLGVVVRRPARCEPDQRAEITLMTMAAMARPLPWLRPSLLRTSTTMASGIATSAPMHVQPRKRDDQRRDRHALAGLGVDRARRTAGSPAGRTPAARERPGWRVRRLRGSARLAVRRRPAGTPVALTGGRVGSPYGGLGSAGRRRGRASVGGTLGGGGGGVPYGFCGCSGAGSCGVSPSPGFCGVVIGSPWVPPWSVRECSVPHLGPRGHQSTRGSTSAVAGQRRVALGGSWSSMWAGRPT